MSRTLVSHALRLFKVSLAVITILYIIQALARDRAALTAALALSPSSLGGVVGLLVLYFILYSYRFLLLIAKHCGCSLPLIPWIRMLVVVRFMNNLVPQMGSVYRGVTLKRDFSVSYTDYVSANIFFIWIDTFLNFSLAAFLLWFFHADLVLFGVPASTGLAAGAVALLLAPLVSHLIVQRMADQSSAAEELTLLKSKLRRVRFFSLLMKKSSKVLTNLMLGLRDLPYMVMTVVIALGSFLCMVGVFKLLLAGVDARASFSTLAVFYALYRLTFHVSITPGNIGIREVAYGLLCAEAQIGMSKGLVVAAELRVLSIITLLLLGIIFAGADLKKGLRLIRRGGPIEGVIES
jgi:hypothetical protein